MHLANLKIKTKIVLISIVITLFTLFIGIYNIVNIHNVDRDYGSFMEDSLYCIDRLDAAKNNLNDSRISIRNYVRDSFVGNDKGIADADESLKKSNPALDQALQDYLDFLIENYPEETEQINKVKALQGQINDIFRPYCKEMLALVQDGKSVESNTLLDESILPLSETIKTSIYEMYDWEMSYAKEVAKENGAKTSRVILISVVILFITILVGLLLAIAIAGSISKPITKLVGLAEQIGQGNFDLKLDTNRRDEVGAMARSLGVVRDTMSSLVNEMQTLSREFQNGNIDMKIDSSRFQGAYKDVAEGVNQMTTSNISETLMLLNCMNEFGNGNFNADIPKLPGKKSAMNDTIDTIRENLKAVGNDIHKLVEGASNGQLSNRVNTDAYKGDWSKIMDQLNGLMKAIVLPIQEASQVLQQVSAGNFDQKMVGDYQGDFLIIKSSINDTVTNVASYIDEISRVLTALSQNDLDQSITREYVGKFSNIKDALNNIIDTLNTVISDISSASEQVAAGARQISESSMTLAQGATQQAASIEELNATIHTINQGTAQNAESAKTAENLSMASKDNATKGDRDMNNMLASINGIKESSASISKIIKVIDDIAFQTNLLALNAAVEAARAGTHGKGFAVVAEEVRSLAGRSQNAAKETSSLIEESIARVGEGTQIAGTTASALQTIVSDATKMASIITDISKSSSEQAYNISQMLDGIAQISEVVQSNSATSEESASASQQLSSQAEVLNGLVSVFKLRENYQYR